MTDLVSHFPPCTFESSGIRSTIRSSSFSFPRRASCIVAMPVIVFVIEAQWKIVFASTRRPLSTSANPWNSRARIFSPSRNQKLPPTTPLFSSSPRRLLATSFQVVSKVSWVVPVDARMKMSRPGSVQRIAKGCHRGGTPSSS